MTQQRPSKPRPAAAPAASTPPSPHDPSPASPAPPAARSARPPASAARRDPEAIRFPRFRPSAPEDSPPPPAVSSEGLPELLTYADLVILFGRTARSLRRWAAAGHLPTVRIGGVVFFVAEDVRRVIAGRVARRVAACAARLAKRRADKS